MNLALIILWVIGGFWMISGVIFLVQMGMNNFEGAKKVHQDMDPAGADWKWWIKIIGVTLVGIIWVSGAFLYLFNREAGVLCISIGLWTVVAEQVLTMLLSLKYWKSYTGIAVGLVFFFGISYLIG
ncbi:MAG: hypothetical protein PQJ60_08610 [Spirochaetales bacterium]|nr:hypothetical protein [Spirochaetales bacterium]